MSVGKILALIGALLVLLVLFGGGYLYFLTNQQQSTFPGLAGVDNSQSSSDTAQVESQDESATGVSEADRHVAGKPVDRSDLANITAMELPVSMDKALEERIVGNPNAPIKISEHSSLSCGHCGNFHRVVFKDFKANWLDTGRAYLVFSDFPLNASALRATMALRCIGDDEQYFALLEELFAKQDDWAYQSDYLNPLKTIFAKYGIDGDDFKACINNKELETGILNRLRAIQQQFGVNSTPTFVVNNSVSVSGGNSYGAFNAALEKALEQINNPNDAGEQ